MASPELFVLLVSGIVLVLCALLTGVLVRLDLGERFPDGQGVVGHRKEVRGVSNTGGVAIFASMVLALGAALVWAIAGSGHAVAEALRSERDLVVVLILGMFAMHTLGLVDDRRPMPALPKLAGMTAVTVVPMALMDIRLLTLLDAQPGGAVLSGLLTIVWVLAITNAMNFLDNMDGVCAGATAVIGAALLTVALVTGDIVAATVLGCVCGAALGFLVWNRPRAAIFMGDGGSLVLGFLLAVLSVRLTYFDGASAGSAWTAVFVPLAVFAVPIYDLCSVVVIRLAQGRSPLVGDQQHFTHRMRMRGLSDRRTLFVVLGCCVITGLSGLLMLSLPAALAPVAAAQVVLILVILAVYERGALRRPDGPGGASA